MGIKITTADTDIYNFLVTLSYTSESTVQENSFIFYLMLYSTTPSVAEDYTAWNGRMTVNTELGTWWKKAAVATLRIIREYLSGNSEDNHK
jgi:hypothetical protein